MIFYLHVVKFNNGVTVKLYYVTVTYAFDAVYKLEPATLATGFLTGGVSVVVTGSLMQP